MKDEFIQSYGRSVGANTNRNEEQEHAVISDINNGRDDEADFTEDDESTIEETEQALHSNSVNREDRRLHETFTISSDSSSESYFSVSDEADFEEEEEEEEEELERTPIRDVSRSFGYSPLRIHSIHLPPVSRCDVGEATAKTPVSQFTEHSTAQVRDRKRAHAIRFTPVAVPLAGPPKCHASEKNSYGNANSDTDTSLVAPCCTGLHKFKW